MTQPLEPLHVSNTILGYSALLGDSPFHLENISFVSQLSMFSGIGSTVPDLYFVRPVYAFLASLFLPIAGFVGSLQLVNVLCWCVSVWLASVLAWRLTGASLASFLSGLLTAGGFGYLAHFGDYSAHLMSFTAYSAGVVAIHSSGVWKERRPLRIHLALGLLMAVCCLQYNTGLALVIAYVWVAWRPNAARHVFGAAAIALFAQRLWMLELGWVRASFGQAAGPADLYGTESEYLRRSLKDWMSLVPHPVEFARTFVADILSFACFEMPLIVALGTYALWRLRRLDGFGRFASPFLIAPLCGGMAYARCANARGYLVYCVTIVIYVSLAVFLARLCGHTRGTGRRMVGIAITVMVLSAQIAWDIAAVAGNPGPAKYYFLGGWNNLAMVFAPPEISPLTGDAPLPTLFGGHGSLADAGAFTNRSGDPIEDTPASSRWVAVLLRACIAAYVLAIAWAIGGTVPRTQSRRVAACGIVLALVPPAVAPAFVAHVPIFQYVHGRPFPAETHELAYSFHPGSGVQERIRRLAKSSDVTVVFLGGVETSFESVALIASGSRMELSRRRDGLWEGPTAKLAPLFSDGALITVHAALGGARTYRGWQSNTDPDRMVLLAGDFAGPGLLPVLPALEFRFLGTGGRTLHVMY